MDISYALRFALSNTKETEIILELPIVLVHPISMDPPPGPYAATPREDCRQFLFALFQGSEDPIASATASAPSTPASRPGTPASCPTSARTAKSTSTSKKTYTRRERLSRLGRSIAQWLLKQRRPRRSNSARLLAALPHTQQQQQQQQQNNQNQNAQDTSTSEPSAVRIRHGKVRSPKQFGRRPGCQGDAGLDIRQKLNVATATEAWQPCQAERWNGQAVDTTARVIWRQPPWSNGIRHAPSEKFELSTRSPPSPYRPSVTTSTSDNQHGLPPLPPSAQGQHHHKYPRGQGMKRMLASSRYMKHLQTNSLPVTQDGRRLLTLSTLQQRTGTKGEGLAR